MIDHSEAPEKDPYWLQLCLLILILSLSCYGLATTISDCDLWGHLRFGLDYLAAGRVFDNDPYSYITAGERWVNHSWLAEVAYALCYKAGGIVGLSLLKVFLALSIIGVLFVSLCKSGVKAFQTAFIMIFALIGLLPVLTPLRPHLFTYLLLCVILQILKTGGKWLFVLPVIFLFWANLHGGALSGLLFVFLYFAADLVQNFLSLSTSAKALWQSALVKVGILAACTLPYVVNPYGLEMLRCIIETSGMHNSPVIEWMPLTIYSAIAPAYIICVLIAGVCWFKTEEKKTLPQIVSLLFAAVQPLCGHRHYPIFLITLFIIWGGHMASVIRRYSKEPRSLRAHPRLVAGTCLAASIALFIASIPHLQKIPVSKALPIQAVSLIKDAGFQGNLAVFFDWGEYCIWHLYPAVKVSFDGRWVSAYSEKDRSLNIAFTYGTPDWDKLLNSFKTDLVLVSKDTASYALMKMKSGWQSCYEDANCALFAPSNSAIARSLSAIHPRPALCDFP